MSEQTKKSNKGRKKSGNAKTTTQRVNALDTALKASGGRILSRVRLSAEAAIALSQLSESKETERTIIERSLILAAKNQKILGIQHVPNDI